MANETTDNSGSSVDNSSPNPLAGIFGQPSPSAQAAAQTPPVTSAENPLAGVFSANKPPAPVPSAVSGSTTEPTETTAPVKNPLAGIFGNRPIPVSTSAPARTTAEPEPEDSTWDKIWAVAKHPLLSYGPLKYAAMPELALPKLLGDAAEQELRENHPTLAKIAGAYSGQAAATDEAVRGMTSPLNLGIMLATGGLGATEGVAGKAVARLVNMGFSLDSLYNAYAKFPEVKQAVDAGDWKAAANGLTSMATSVGMAGAAGLHSLGTVEPIESESEAGKGKAKGKPVPVPAAEGNTLRTPLANLVDSDFQKAQTEQTERGPQDETQNHESRPVPKGATETTQTEAKPEENPLKGVFEKTPEARAVAEGAGENKTEAAVPQGSRAGTDPDVKPVDVQDETTRTAETQAKTASGLPKSTVVPDSYKPTITKDSLLAESVQRIVSNSEVLKTVLDPAKIQTPADIDRALDAAEPLIERGLDPDVRSRISLDMQRQLALDSGLSFSDLLSREQGETWSTERTIAARMLSAQNAKVMFDLSKAADSDPGNPDALQKFGAAAALQAELKSRVLGLRSEAGRTLGGFRVQVSPEDYANMKLTDVVADLPKDKLAYAAKLMSSLDSSSPTYAKTVNNISAELADNGPADKFWEFYKNSLLSSPSTIIKKSVSELLLGVLTGMKKAGVGLAAQAKSAAGMTDAPEAYPSEAVWFAKGAAKALADAKPILSGEFKLENAPDFQETHAFKGTLGTIIRTPSRILSRSADVVYWMNFKGELESLAARQTLAENNAGKITDEEMPARQDWLANNPTKEMNEAADKQALYGTYQSKLSKTGLAAQQFINSNPVTKTLLPFFKTPVNLVKASWEFSPAGLIEGTAKGDLNKQVAGLLGSGIAAAIAYGALTGTINGGGPVNYKERKVMEDSGFLPYSVKIGGTNISYHKAEPLGLLAATIADTVHGSLQDEGPVSQSKTENAVTHAARNATSLPFLNQVSEIFEAATHLGDRTTERIADNMLASIAVPSIVKNVAQIIDPVRRDPDRQGLSNPVPGAVQTVAERLPVLSKTVAPEISSTGEESKRLPSEAGAINPFPWVKNTNRDDTLQEMGRLGITPPAPPKLVPLKRKNAENKSVEIPDSTPTKEEAQALNKIETEEFYRVLDAAMSHTKWSEVPDAERKLMASQFKEKIAQKRLTRLRQLQAEE